MPELPMLQPLTQQAKALLTASAPAWVWIVVSVTIGVMLAADVPDRLSSVEAVIEEIQDVNTEDSRRLKKVECLVEAFVLDLDPYERGCWRL